MAYQIPQIYRKYGHTHFREGKIQGVNDSDFAKAKEILCRQSKHCSNSTAGASYTVDVLNGCLNGIMGKEQSFVAHHYHKITEVEYFIKKKKKFINL